MAFLGYGKFGKWCRLDTSSYLQKTWLVLFIVYKCYLAHFESNKNLLIFFFSLPFYLAQSFTYQCSIGQCETRSADKIEGTSEDAADLCSRDHPKCKAYEYSANLGYGRLCYSASKDRIHSNYGNNTFCVKTSG